MSVVRWSRRLAAVVAGMGVVVVAGPVLAQTVVVRDPAGDMSTGGDVRKVRIVHEDRVVVRVHHKNLRADGTEGEQVFFDTDRSRPGPEFVFSAGLFDGTDYALSTATRGWKQGHRVSCDYRAHIDYDTEVSRYRLNRACLGTPTKVRVAVRTTSSRPSGVKRDWLTGYRHWTEPVRRG